MKKQPDENAFCCPAGVVGNHVKFVGLHAVMSCKVPTSGPCLLFFLRKMGGAGGKTWQVHNHVKRTEPFQGICPTEL